MPRPARVEPPPHPDLSFELSLWEGGLTLLAGLDEAGRGAWAGPVYAAAVILPRDNGILDILQGVRDSKKMTPRQRTYWAGRIRLAAAGWGIGAASAEEIDSRGIVAATRLAMQRALEACSCQPEHLLIDALRLPGVNVPQLALIKGDARSLSIAAASVLAKTARDAWMAELGEQYPGYGFAAHKGYGTRMHREALARLGPCAEHRRSYGPVRGWEFNRARR
jgi:ribonuclease HII